MKVVIVSGGTGGLRTNESFRKYAEENPDNLREEDLTAIVTPFDDGGSTGEIIKARMPKLGKDDFLAPGDLRQCLCALGHNKDMCELFKYRPKEGKFAGHPVGNIVFDSIFEKSENFEETITKLKNVLDVKAQVKSCALKRAMLCAELKNGKIIKGQTNVGTHKLFFKSPLKRLFLEPDVEANPNALESIRKADLIVLAAGSLYTSLLPNLITKGVSDAIKESNAKIVYIINLMTQRGETDDLTANDHVNELIKHSGVKPSHICISDNSLSDKIKKNYDDEFQKKVENDLNGNYKVIKLKHIESDGLARHDHEKLAETIMSNI